MSGGYDQRVAERIMELLNAVQAGNLNQVAKLLDGGADPDECGYEGVTPLILAASSGQAGIAAALLEHGAEINRPGGDSQTALVHAISSRNDEVTDLLLDRGADPAVTNWLAFYRAVESGHIPLVQRLLNLGADPNLREDDELTPLLAAVGGGDLQLVKLLLDAGADPRTTTGEGATALDLAIEGRQRDIVELLEKRIAASGRTLLAAVKARDAGMVEKLVRQGVPVNIREAEFGYTPLSWAAECGSARIARLLIAGGADLEARDFLEQTPLWTAVTNDHIRVVRVLLQAGANCNIRDHTGDTLLQSAAWAEAIGSIKLPLQAGADVNAVGGGAPAALHWAVARRLRRPDGGDLELVEELPQELPIARRASSGGRRRASRADRQARLSSPRRRRAPRLRPADAVPAADSRRRSFRGHGGLRNPRQ